MFVKDEQHRWVLLNAACCAFMGRDRAALLGKSDYDFFPPDEARVFWEKDDLVFARGGVNENEERFTDAAGRTHVIVTRKTLHVDAHGRRFLLGVITDITPLHEANEQLRASRDELEDRVRQRTAELTAANARLRAHDERRAAFLNLLGHELRNPVSALSTTAMLMERLPADSPQLVRARAVVQRQVEHLARLCDDLLDAARLASGKLEIRREVLDLAAVVADLCEDLSGKFQERQVALGFQGCPRPCWVDADQTRLAQALGNLLHNALKFTPPGGRVDVGVRGGPGAVEVVVRDSGIGIPPDEIDRMFEPFVQAAAPGARAQGGLGIGLAIARGLVEAHGGTVRARSEGKDRGVEFTVTLPAVEPPGAGDEARAGAAARSGDTCVVLIEDEVDFRESLAELLRVEGFRVEVAVDGASGVALVSAVRPAAVLCDLGLPDVDGCEVARRIRADPDPAVASTRIVALSGFAHPEDVARSLAAGFDAHLPKPPSLPLLEALVSGRPLEGGGAGGRPGRPVTPGPRPA